MAAPRNLNEVRERDGRSLKNYCAHDPRCKEIRERGDHVICRGPHGSVVFCDREMGTGLWKKVIKMMIAVGLGLFLICSCNFINGFLVSQHATWTQFLLAGW